jgi:hypothetical protein
MVLDFSKKDADYFDYRYSDQEAKSSTDAPPGEGAANGFPMKH